MCSSIVPFLIAEWTTLFASWSDKHGSLDNFLHRLAEAGNVDVLAPIMLQYSKEAKVDMQDEHGNTFLHTFAQKHNLKDLFRAIDRKRTSSEENADIMECFKKQNKNGYTFLAVAVNNVENENIDKPNEDDITESLKLMSDMYGLDVVSDLCKQTDKGDNSLVHLAVWKTMMKLMAFVLPKTDKAHEIENKDGYNPLHLAIQRKNVKFVRHISKQESFDVNKPMKNGETALHIAAQFGYCEVLGELIEHGGDLSVRDEEDGHTPLHDCLQQVYFEGHCTEEKCEKFIKVWNMVVEKSVTWWCLQQGLTKPAKGSHDYLELQCKAVYYLRSCIKNTNGLSVLQFAADRGLVRCVQTMLSTKDVFVKPSTIQKARSSYEIDITNLCPEYFVQKNVLYRKQELERLESEEERPATLEKEEQEEKGKSRGNRCQSQAEDNSQDIISFLEALNQVKPPTKAGEILESIRMMTLTRAEWRISKRAHILWGILHFLLMLFSTIFTTYKNDSSL